MHIAHNIGNSSLNTSISGIQSTTQADQNIGSKFPLNDNSNAIQSDGIQR